MRGWKLIAVALLSPVLAVAAEMRHEKPVPNPVFAKLSTLVGSWEAPLEGGKVATVRYELVSSGTALLERIGGDEHRDMDMVTVYHPDGGRLVMTHYCSANNQPRMRAEPATGEIKKLAFSFVDATNLASPDAGHMHGLVVSFEDADHFTQEWKWREKGAENSMVFRWTRKR